MATCRGVVVLAWGLACVCSGTGRAVSVTTLPASPTTSQCATLPVLYVDEFGVTEGEPIDSGSVFVDGRYIDAPYVVTRRGLGVLVNGVLVDRWAAWPIKTPPHRRCRPAAPGQHQSEHVDVRRVRQGVPAQKIAYVQKHCDVDDEARIMEQVYRDLPMVKEAHVDPQTGGLYVETYDGEFKGIIGLRAPRRKGPTTKEEVLAAVETKRAYLEKGLQRGGARLFFASGSEASMGDARLGQAVPILRSAASTEEKLAQLVRAGILHPEDCRQDGLFIRFVRGFVASPQLEARLGLTASGVETTRPTESRAGRNGADDGSPGSRPVSGGR